jgi:hypothetical protein
VLYAQIVAEKGFDIVFQGTSQIPEDMMASGVVSSPAADQEAEAEPLSSPSQILEEVPGRPRSPPQSTLQEEEQVEETPPAPAEAEPISKDIASNLTVCV